MAYCNQLSKMTETINRCFFHELGHYVADQLNKEFYGGLGVEELSVYKCGTPYYRYCGHVTPKKPEGFNPANNPPPPLERLASYLVSLIYGCLFQSYFLKEASLKDCLNNGVDADSWQYTLKYHKIYDFPSFINLHETYFRELQAERSLDDFFKLDPLEYLRSTDGINFIADLDRLNDVLKVPLETHQSKYMQLVDGYQKIINQNVARM